MTSIVNATPYPLESNKLCTAFSQLMKPGEVWYGGFKYSFSTQTSLNTMKTALRFALALFVVPIAFVDCTATAQQNPFPQNITIRDFVGDYRIDMTKTFETRDESGPFLVIHFEKKRGEEIFGFSFPERITFKVLATVDHAEFEVVKDDPERLLIKYVGKDKKIIATTKIKIKLRSIETPPKNPKQNPI